MTIDRKSGIEHWRQLSWAVAYEVSDLGRVRRGPRILRQYAKRGYLYVRISLGSRLDFRWPTVASLIAECFIGPRPVGAQVNHKDGAKANNVASNLEYVTDGENKRHASVMGLLACGQRHGRAKLSTADVRRIRCLYGKRDLRALCKRFGVNRSTIRRIAKRERRVVAHGEF